MLDHGTNRLPFSRLHDPVDQFQHIFPEQQNIVTGSHQSPHSGVQPTKTWPVTLTRPMMDRFLGNVERIDYIRLNMNTLRNRRKGQHELEGGLDTILTSLQLLV